MGEFFKGLRRRIGIVTLLMACVFMGGWIRSPHHCDSFNSPIGNLGIIWLISADSQIGVSVIMNGDSPIAPKSVGWITYLPETFDALFPPDLGFVWRLRLWYVDGSIRKCIPLGLSLLVHHRPTDSALGVSASLKATEIECKESR